MKEVNLLIRTRNHGFIKININGEQITASLAKTDEVPAEIESAPVGAGRQTLHPFLLNEARELCKSYGDALAEPIDYFVMSRKGKCQNWSEIDDEE